MNRDTLAKTLKNRKSELNMTNEIIHQRSGVSVATIKRTFSGERTTMYKVEAIARSMGIVVEVVTRKSITSKAMLKSQTEVRARAMVKKILKSSGLELQRPSKKVEEALYRKAIKRLEQSGSSDIWRQ